MMSWGHTSNLPAFIQFCGAVLSQLQTHTNYQGFVNSYFYSNYISHLYFDQTYILINALLLGHREMLCFSILINFNHIRLNIKTFYPLIAVM